MTAFQPPMGRRAQIRSALGVVVVTMVVGATLAVSSVASAGMHDLCFSVADAGPNGGADHLISVVPSTGVATSIGDTGGTGNIEAIAMEPGGNTLYAVDNAQFGSIDQSTGAFTAIGPGVGGGFDDVDSLTFDPFTGELWGVDRNSGSNQDVLFQIDKTTGLFISGTAVTIQSFAVTGLYDIDDLSISSYDNTMYGVNNNAGGNDRLITVDRTTGAVTQVLDLAALGVIDMEGLAYDNAGILMGTDGEGAPNGDLWEIDIDGGSLTHLADLAPGGDFESLGCLTADLNTMSGTVFFDTNGDGALDVGDAGEGSVTVRLYRDVNGDGLRDGGDILLTSTDTAGDGSYSFDVASSGDFVLDIDTGDLPAGSNLSTDNLEAASLAGFGLTDSGNDFGYTVPAMVGNRVWVDDDVDGIQDGGESGLGSVTVNLLDSGGSTVASTTTAGDGSYLFTGIAPGDYRVEFVAPVGYSFSPVDQGADDTIDSEAAVATGRTDLFTLGASDVDVTLDAGLYQPATVGDFVWVDADADGIQDGGESGLGSVTVNLLDSGGSTVASTTTAGDGSYLFTGIAPGDYRVEFVAPVGYSISPVDQGADDTIDSDAAVGTGRSGLFTLGSGDSDPDVDAGMYVRASVGDVVWHDLDADGIQDSGEPGLSGAVVNLLNSSGSTLASMLTAGDGSYSFTGLVPGDYRVEFVAPSGYTFSPVDQGADDTVDSDADVITGRSPLFTLATGDVESTIDAGLYRPASVGDVVWDDLDADGVQDPGEPGLAGVAVNLLDSGGGTLASTTTAGDGSYSFTGLGPGDYRVEFVAPPGYSFSPADQGADDSVDSDADVTTGRSPLLTLVSDQDDLDVDAGVYSDASVGDVVWEDLDADGVQELGEPGVAGVTVNLLDSGGSTVGSTTTAGDGSYSFTGLGPGDYRVEFVAPPGYSFSPVDQGGDDTADSDAAEGTGQTGLFTLSSGESDGDVDAGLHRDASVGDVVWTDVDADGVQESGEPGVAGVTVNLLDSGGSTAASTTTAGDGSYSFTGVTPGQYQIEFLAPIGYTFSPVDQGADDTVDSDADVTTGRSPLFTLTSGESDGDVDAGLYQDASIGDLVWDDLDADGVQESGEPGVGGVTVNLLDAGGGVLASTTTAGDGTYGFSVVPGSYRVEFVAPVGYSFSPVDQGADDSVDSDADVTTGRSPLFTVVSADSDLTVDAGVYVDASVGDVVWDDLDADGLQESGEPGVGGVTVNLLDAGGSTVASTTTAGDGSYSFTALVPGDYRLEFVAPSGYRFTPVDQGADDTVDSDADVTTGRSPLFTLTSGESDGDVDAGLYRDASIGDLVWVDVDADGVRESGEPGLAGVTVNLLDAGGGVLASTTTAGDGTYGFSVSPGSYRLEFVAPSGYSFTPVDQGADDTLDSDADEVTGRTSPVVVSSGDVVVDLDGGVYQGASIGDVIWDDLDADGVQESGEPGLAGVTVNLLDAGGASVALTVTAGNGSYSFTGVTPGDYRVEFVAPAGYTFSAADQGADDSVDSDADVTTGRSQLLTVVSGDSDATIDAGLYADASVGDVVWVDVDADGVQESGEPGLAGVTVNLLDAGGGVLASTTTAGDGLYSFTGLVPGDYRVEFVAPPGYTLSPADRGGDDTADSDPDPLTGRTTVFTIGSGSTDVSLDAGVFAGALIGDLVWHDLDGDGVQDPGEPGLGGVTVNLLASSWSTVASTVTAGDGSYSFSTFPGSYRVEILAPSGYLFLPADQGGDDTLDSDVAPDGRSSLIVLASGDAMTDLDAGLLAPASIGDTVFFDVDGDGIQDPGEPGVVGISVELRGADGTLLATVVTGPGGTYTFPSLSPGDVTVAAVPATGLASTTPNPQPFGLRSGDAIVTADFGLRGGGSIGRTLWFDTDGDGVRGDGESGIAGVTVELVWAGPDGVLGTDDDLTFVTTTDGDGRYRFDGLPPGIYEVTIDGSTLPDSTRVSASPDGGTDLSAVLSLGDGESITDADFAVTGDGALAFTGLEVSHHLGAALVLIAVGCLLLASTRLGDRPADELPAAVDARPQEW